MAIGKQQNTVDRETVKIDQKIVRATMIRYTRTLLYKVIISPTHLSFVLGNCVVQVHAVSVARDGLKTKRRWNAFFPTAVSRT